MEKLKGDFTKITNNNNKGKEAEIKKSWEARLGKHDRVKGYK